MIITRNDVDAYVYDTLPWDELSDWDIGGIVDDMIEAWPSLIGSLSGDPLLHLGPNRIIDRIVDNDRYWKIVEQHQLQIPQRSAADALAETVITHNDLDRGVAKRNTIPTKENGEMK